MQYHVKRQRRETDFSDLDLQLARGWWREQSKLDVLGASRKREHRRRSTMTSPAKKS